MIEKLNHDANENDSNFFAKELYYTQTDKRKLKESKIKENKLKKDRTIIFQLIEEMNNNIFTTQSTLEKHEFENKQAKNRK
jgi:hypothetical protein